MGNPTELVFVALAQDKATYQQLAEMPEQDAWFRRLAEHVDGDVPLGRRRDGVGSSEGRGGRPESDRKEVLSWRHCSGKT